MCKFCETTNYLISEGINTTAGRKVFADLRFDRENKELDINYGLLDGLGFQGKDVTWSESIEIKYCPFCGVELEYKNGRNTNDI